MSHQDDKTKRYRAASWWITWDDLSYPDLGIKEKVEKKAAQFNDAGINLAIVFGVHFRWDFIDMWDRVHDYLKLVADELHKYDIQLFDHHSATLVCRPDNVDERWDNFYRNKHHIPFYPDKSVRDNLMFNGSKLNDFRMIDVVTEKPCFLPAYTAEIFCMNNPDFQAAYCEYAKRLFGETGVDGLMCDDIIYYPGWRGCACKHCKAKFKKLYGHTLPANDDTSFWGNYDSQMFKDWVEMRYNDGTEFLGKVKAVLPENTPLLTCCSNSWPKHVDQAGMSLCSFQNETNHGMLEMCSEIISEDNQYTDRIPDILLHSGILSKNSYPSLGLGYGFCKDTAFLIWALNGLTGSSTWMSTLKGRLGLGKEACDFLPDEEKIVTEGFLFEKKYPQLFTNKSYTKTALFFSFDTLKFGGDSREDYTNSYKETVSKLFLENIPFDVIDSLDLIQNYSCLLLNDIHCLAVKEMEQIDKFIKNGGTVIATGPLGECDSKGNEYSNSFLNYLGIAATIEREERTLLPLDKFFTMGEWPPVRNVEQLNHISFNDKTYSPKEWITVTKGSGKLCWRGERAHTTEAVQGVVDMLNQQQLSSEFEFSLPGKWFWRLFKEGNRYIIHVLSNEITSTEDPVIENRMTERKLVRELQYHTEINELQIKSSIPIKHSRFYSPDIDDVCEGEINDTTISFKLDKIKRYFIIELTT